MTGWRHREKNRILNADQKKLDVQKAVHEIVSHVDRECLILRGSYNCKFFSAIFTVTGK